MFSFSSSPFSVTLERIEKCAADSQSADFAYDIVEQTSAILDPIRAEISGNGEPDFECIRKGLYDFSDNIICFFKDDDGFLGLLLSYSTYEHLYSKVCLDLLKLENSPLSDEELALPFLVIDFLRLAAEHFNTDIDELYRKKISFEDAIEFVCNLNMPESLKKVIARHAANCVAENKFRNTPTPRIIFDNTVAEREKTFMAYLNNSPSVWRIKAEKPCGLCLKEVNEMHDFLNVFGNIAQPQASAENVPAVLEPPYTLEKLLKNLLPYECPFHDMINADEDYSAFALNEEEQLRYEFASPLLKLAEVTSDTPADKIKIAFAVRKLNGFNEIFPYQDRRTGEYDFEIPREEYEQNYPWCKPYFLWLDALNSGENQNDCILPEVLKGSCDLDQGCELLCDEWKSIAEDLEKDIREKFLADLPISLEDLRNHILNREQALKSLLLKRCGSWEMFLARGGDSEKLSPIRTILNNNCRFARLFADPVPSVDASVEEIGDFFQTHAQDSEEVKSTPPSKKFGSSTIRRLATKHFHLLENRLAEEMRRIADDENTSVYIRENMLEYMASLPVSDASEILKNFRKKHGLQETGSKFSDKMQKIKEMCDAEESRHRAELAEAAAAERRKVLFEMSHSIKNLLASVSEPLSALQDELDGSQRKTVANALAGAGLIRDLAVGVHMSMRGTPGTWRKDVLEPGFGANTLDKIILDAMRHAVSNMFDGKYFNLYVRNYFGRDLNTFMQAQNEWKNAESAADTFACINKYFFDFRLDDHGANLNIPIGDRDGTAAKLLILFQELFLNAVKYSSFTERGKRFVKLDIDITPETWNFVLANSAAGHNNTKSSGIGLSVIKNFAELFEAKYQAGFESGNYISNLKFLLNK